MGMDNRHYVMYGIVIPRNEFIGDIWDEQWEPYTEGSPDVGYRILFGEGDDNLYIGAVLGDSVGTYTDDGYMFLATCTGLGRLMMDTEDWLIQNNLPSQSAALMLVTMWG